MRVTTKAAARGLAADDEGAASPTPKDAGKEGGMRFRAETIGALLGAEGTETAAAFLRGWRGGEKSMRRSTLGTYCGAREIGCEATTTAQR